MGKKLIIKNADFSQIAIEQTEWYVREVDNAIASGRVIGIPRSAYYGAIPHYDFGGKSINVLRFKAAKSGTLKIYSGTSYTDTNPTLLASVPFIISYEGQIIKIDMDNPIVVPAGHKIWLGKRNVEDDTLFYAVDNYATGLQFIAQCGSSAAADVPSTLLLDIGYKHNQ